MPFSGLNFIENFWIKLLLSDYLCDDPWLRLRSFQQAGEHIKFLPRPWGVGQVVENLFLDKVRLIGVQCSSNLPVDRWHGIFLIVTMMTMVMLIVTMMTTRETQPLRRLSTCSFKRVSVERFLRFFVFWTLLFLNFYSSGLIIFGRWHHVVVTTITIAAICDVHCKFPDRLVLRWTGALLGWSARSQRCRH